MACNSWSKRFSVLDFDIALFLETVTPAVERADWKYDAISERWGPGEEAIPILKRDWRACTKNALRPSAGNGRIIA
jgi:hypothetical protein